MKKANNAGETSTAKIVLWYMVSNVFARGIAVLTTPIFSRLLSKSEYGQFANFTSWESILVILVTLNLSSSVARAKYDFNEKMDTYIFSLLGTGNILTILICGIVEIFPDYFVELFSMNISFIRLLFIYLLFTPAFTYLQIKHRIYSKYKFCVLFSMGSAILRTGISVILVYFMHDKLLGRIYGYVIPITMLNIVLWIYIFRNGKRIEKESLVYGLKISVPLIPHALSGILLNNADRIMITNICGEEKTALYTIPYSISMLSNLIWTSMNQAWTPWLFDRMHEGNKKSIWKFSKIYLGIFSLLIIGILLVSPELILIFGGKAYFESRYVMPPVIVGCAFQFVYGMYVNIETYVKKTAIISIGTMIAAGVNLGLNWLLIPKYGYIAAAYTTLIGYGILLAIHYTMVYFVAREYFDIYDKKFVFGITGLICFVGASMLWLYEHDIIRYAIIGFYIILIGFGLIRYWADIKKMVKK